LALDDMMGGGRRSNPRRSGTRALTFWVVALIAGGSAALLLRWYIERTAVVQPVTSPMTKIVVAAIDLPIATTLRPEHLRLADWPASVQPVGSLRDTKEITGRVIIARVVQGEPILASKLASKEGGRGLAALIPAGMRAQAVRVDEVVGVAGFVHPDDRVDVIATMSTTEGTISKVVLQNVKVLAVGKDLDVSDYNRARAVPVTVVTVLVSPSEAEKMALIASTARLTLALRSWTDDTIVSTTGAFPSSLLNGVEVVRRAPAPVASAEVGSGRRKKPLRVDGTTPSVAASPQKDVIEILRGDRFEERKFDKEKP
jgi:pilus assembly protein CpaB